MTDLYAGTWDLVPELCLYDEGSPPDEATYEVDSADGVVRVRISWRPAGAAAAVSAAYEGPDDGSVTPVTGVPGVTGQSITRVDERTLDSAAWDGDAVVAAARRVASADGELLVVLQSSTGSQGAQVRTYQVYRRRR